MDVVERLCDFLLVIAQGRVIVTGPTLEITGGRRLQDVFVELVGCDDAEEVDISWLGPSSA